MSRERGVKLNRDTLEVGVTHVRYFGHMLTSEGVRTDPDDCMIFSLKIHYCL